MMSSGRVCVTLIDVGLQFTDQNGTTCNKQPSFTEALLPHVQLGSVQSTRQFASSQP